MYNISVIIPVYNVEEYVDECIESLVNQTFKNFEIIVINDGSIDSSRYILEKYEENLDNLTLINQENSGSAGGPRNRGIELAKGKYIFFLDPDDRLPSEALEVMYNKIEESNADFLCGNFLKFTENKAWTLKHVTEALFLEEKITDFNNEIEFSRNLISCNKLYKKEFLFKHNIFFNEELRYGEDRSFILKAYAFADKIHIIPDCIYYYRQREDENNKSATQNFDIEFFRQSIEACRMDEKILKNSPCKHSTKDLYDKNRVQHDFLRFIDKYAHENISGELWIKVLDLSKEYIKLVDENLSLLSYEQRRKIEYIVNEDINGLIKYVNTKRKLYKIINEKNNAYIRDFNLVKRSGLDSIHNVTPKDINVFHKIENINIINSQFLIEGWAYIYRENIKNKEQLKKQIIFKSNKGSINFELRSCNKLITSLKKGKLFYNYKYCGFKGKINLEDLINIVSKEDPSVKIYLKIGMNEKLYKEIYINEIDIYNYIKCKSTNYKISQRIEDISICEDCIKMCGVAFIENYTIKDINTLNEKIILINNITHKEVEYDVINKDNEWYNSNFIVNPYKIDYKKQSWQTVIPYKDITEGRYDLYIEIFVDGIRVREKLKYPSMKLIRKRRKLDKGLLTFNKSYRFEFNLTEYNREECKVTLIVKDLKSNLYEINGGYIPMSGYKSNYWNIEDQEDFIIKRIAVTRQKLEFWGTFLNIKEGKKILCIENSENEKYRAMSEKYDFIYDNDKECGFKGIFDYNQKTSLYQLKLNLCDDSRKERYVDNFRLSKNLDNNKNVWNAVHYVGTRKIKFIKKQNYAKSNIYTIYIEINNSYLNLFKGILIKITNRIKKKLNKNFIFKKLKNRGLKFRSKIYIYMYNMFSLLPVKKDRITLVSYKESMPSDYILFYNKIKENYPYIDVKFIGGNEKTLSKYVNMAWRFATSKNIIIDSYYRHLYNVKHRKETNFIQIWHATGIFKRFALLAVGKDQANSREFEINAHHYYTNVIVSGDFIAEPYAEAFGISSNKVLPLGVSRTDEFFDETVKKDSIEKIHEIYPFTKNKKIILYAPTFRGNDRQRKVFRNHLDYKKLHALKEKGYIILYKMHPAVTEPLEIPNYLNDFVYDVTKYPNINELFFIADILITDYSSSIFEFSLLRKPIIFFAYDLGKYLNERGFYYDYESFVPGPICKRTEEIVSCINNIEKIKFDYDKFIKKYMNRCDGHSTERLIELVMKERKL